MAENEQVITETPEQSGGSGSAGKTTPQNARIFAMPERYRHGKEGKVHEPAKPVPKPKPVPPPAKPVPKPVVAIGKKQGMPSSTKALIIVGSVILVALLVGGYLIMRSQQKNQTSDTPIPPVIVKEDEPKEEIKEIPKEDETELTESQNPFPKSSTPGVDTDSDGLTDLEESLVYGTNPRLPDTDKDGFLDGNEVFHKYNPNGTQPGTLLESNLAKKLEAEKFSMLYPAKWLVKSEEGFDNSISITTGEKITLKVEEKPEAQTLVEWYQAKAKEVQVEESITKNGYPQLVAENQLTSYIDLGNSVLVLDYDTGIKGTVDYLQSFQMMINSVELKEVQILPAETQ